MYLLNSFALWHNANQGRFDGNQTLSWAPTATSAALDARATFVSGQRCLCQWLHSRKFRHQAMPLRPTGYQVCFQDSVEIVYGWTSLPWLLLVQIFEIPMELWLGAHPNVVLALVGQLLEIGIWYPHRRGSTGWKSLASWKYLISFHTCCCISTRHCTVQLVRVKFLVGKQLLLNPSALLTN